MFQDGIFGTAILSKYPMETKDLSDHGRALVRANIALPNGKKLAVDGIHLTPNIDNKNGKREFYGYRNSRDKAKWLRDKTGINRGLYIVAGDLNALSPEDKYEKDELLTGYRIFIPDEESARWLLNENLKGEEIKAILGNGSVDTYKSLHPTKPGYTLPTKIGGDKRSSSRIDYIFTSPDIIIKGAGVIRTPDTEIASDHYPIFAEISL